MIETELPTNPDDLTVDILNTLIEPQIAGATITDFEIVEAHVWGTGDVSSAGRMVLKPIYASPSTRDLPRHIVAKVARVAPDAGGSAEQRRSSGALYVNEVNVYTRLKPAAFLEAPRVMGGAYDPATHTFLLLLEDLRDRGATFANVTVPTSLVRMHTLLDALATLHARYWNSPELATSLDWMETHLRGDLHNIFNTPTNGPLFIQHQVATTQFKREMVERLGTTIEGLFVNFQTAQRHQSRLPQTVCHGDTHIGNTYILPDGSGGLLDWQLTSKGHAMHDVSYLLATGLTVAERRAHERDLLAYYRERLLEKGVKDAPTADQLWTEYRHAMIWGVYIGWLITPVINYGWEITVMNHLRVMTAYEDLDTGKALERLK